MKRLQAIVLTALLILGAAAPCAAADGSEIDTAIAETAAYLLTAANPPQAGTVGGEWAVLGLARSGAEVPEEYYRRYYENAEKAVRAAGGTTHTARHTEYSRMILALTAIGKNPSNVAGCDLLLPLGDYEKTVRQGTNGAVWALIALDSGGYEVPRNPDAATQATRELYLNRILDSQLPDGGWALGGETSDPDMTAMALTALAGYREDDRVRKATERALFCLSAMQDGDGGFSGWGTENSESCAQVLSALCALGISYRDARFVKGGNTLPDVLLSYREGSGFRHDSGGQSLMASEQCFCSLVALRRFLDGKSGFYDMTDAAQTGEPGEAEPLGTAPPVRKTEVTSPGKTFADIAGLSEQTAIEALAERGVLGGRGGGAFEPSAAVTRAEFAATVTRALGLPAGEGAAFSDVEPGDWFSGAVSSAYRYGIVNGISRTEFAPDGTLTREEAAVMTARAAKLCGMDTERSAAAARDMLAGFPDYRTVSEWAAASVAFCCEEEILPGGAAELRPQEPATRAEIAQMLFQLLKSAQLL